MKPGGRGGCWGSRGSEVSGLEYDQEQGVPGAEEPGKAWPGVQALPRSQEGPKGRVAGHGWEAGEETGGQAAAVSSGWQSLGPCRPSEHGAGDSGGLWSRCWGWHEPAGSGVCRTPRELNRPLQSVQCLQLNKQHLSFHSLTAKPQGHPLLSPRPPCSVNSWGTQIALARGGTG